MSGRETPRLANAGCEVQPDRCADPLNPPPGALSDTSARKQTVKERKRSNRDARPPQISDPGKERDCSDSKPGVG